MLLIRCDIVLYEMLKELGPTIGSFEFIAIKRVPFVT